MKKLVSLFLVLALALTMLVGLSVTAAAEEEHITVSIINTQEDDHPKNFTDDIAGDPGMVIWYDKIQHLLPGYIIDLEILEYTDEFQQLALLIAGGDTPDISTASGITFFEYIDQGIFIDDLTDLLNEYGQNILAEVSPENMAICTVGGMIRAIPTENIAYKFPTWMRADWLDKLGYEYDHDDKNGMTYFTLSEVKEILTRMTLEDPDGNGVADTYGLGTRFNGGDWTQTFMPIMGAFGGQPHQNYLADGVITPFDVSDEFRAALEYLRDLYAIGAIDQECFILNYDQALMNAGNGKGGMYSGWWNQAGQICDAGLLDNVPEARMVYIRITSDDGAVTGVKNNGSIWKTHMISADMEHPEAAMAIMNFQYTQEGYDTCNGTVLDEEGHFTYDDTGILDPYHRVVAVKNWSLEYPQATEDELYAVGKRKNPLSNLFSCMYNRNYYLAAELYAQGVEEEVHYDDWKLELRSLWNSRGDRITRNVDNHKMYQDVFYGYPQTEEYLEYNASLESLMKEWVVNFVTGQVELDDAGWAQYRAAYVAKGGQKVLDSMVAVYNELNGSDVKAFEIAK
ncbi:MAG: hypothetical protein IJ048_04015 [Clostridia bacterium]|nr:hypothetical protein [Clostridia bacterium]